MAEHTGETVWAWLEGEGWIPAYECEGGPGVGCGSGLERQHRVRRSDDGDVVRCYIIQYRDPSSGGGDMPRSPRVWAKNETVWARLKARGWTRARMFSTTWIGDMASVYLGRSRSPVTYLVDRLTGLMPRDPALKGRDRPPDGTEDALREALAAGRASGDGGELDFGRIRSEARRRAAE